MIQPRKTTAAQRRTMRQRGYGPAHFKIRRNWEEAVALGLIRCSICGKRIEPATPWQLAHADHPQAHELGLYAGPAHRACNQAEANRSHLPRRRTPPPRAPALSIFDSPKRKQLS